MKKENKNMKSKLEVEITNIDVSEFYYSFNYKITQDGSVSVGEVSDDYSNGDTPKKWKKSLENGLAVRFAIEQYL